MFKKGKYGIFLSIALVLYMQNSMCSSEETEKQKDNASFSKRHMSKLCSYYPYDNHCYDYLPFLSKAESNELNLNDYDADTSYMLTKNIPNEDSITEHDHMILVQKKKNQNFSAPDANALFIAKYQEIEADGKMEKKILSSTDVRTEDKNQKTILIIPSNTWEKKRLLSRLRIANDIEKYNEIVRKLNQTLRYITRLFDLLMYNLYSNEKKEKLKYDDKVFYETYEVLKEASAEYRNSMYKKTIGRIEKISNEVSGIIGTLKNNSLNTSLRKNACFFETLLKLTINPISEILKKKINNIGKEENIKDNKTVIHILLSTINSSLKEDELSTMAQTVYEKITEVAGMCRKDILRGSSDTSESIRSAKKEILDLILADSYSNLTEADKIKNIVIKVSEETISALIDSYQMAQLERTEDGLITKKEYDSEYVYLKDNFSEVFNFIYDINLNYRFRIVSMRNVIDCIRSSFSLTAIPLLKRSFDKNDEGPMHCLDSLLTNSDIVDVRTIYNIIYSVYNYFITKISMFDQVYNNPAFLIIKKEKDFSLKKILNPNSSRKAFIIYCSDTEVYTKKISLTQENLNAFKNAESLSDLHNIEGKTCTDTLVLEPKYKKALDEIQKADKEQTLQWKERLI